MNGLTDYTCQGLRTASMGNSLPDLNQTPARRVTCAPQRVIRPPQMGSSKADTQYGAAKDLTGYRGSGLISTSSNGMVLVHTSSIHPLASPKAEEVIRIIYLP
ncbi:hypothetical protein SFRURICE_001121 [Spodoptera frugiperda]|nr:hypothetical protein SFRURICE_001121 [Spodoptera frugiperda]